MTDILRTIMQRLQPEPPRERPSHERRSVQAVRERLNSQNSASGLADILGIAFHETQQETIDRNPVRFASDTAKGSVTEVPEMPPSVVEPDTRVVDGLSDNTTEASQIRADSGSQSAATRSHATPGPDEQMNPPSGPAINVSGIVEMVRDELRPLLDDLGTRMTRTIRSEGNSRQFRLRANQVD